MRALGRLIGTITGGGLVLAVAAGVAALGLGSWSTPVSVESIPGTSGSLNTAALEGCPFVAQRGDVLYFASNREDGVDLDIYASHRTVDGGWGAPIYFSEVNTAADEICPMAHRNGKTFLFISNRAGGQGGADIYATRLHTTLGWSAPTNLGAPINSSGDEFSPSLTDTELYFSSTRSGGLGGGDIYVAPFDGAAFGVPVLAASLSSAANDFRPNVRRDGLEIFFDSNRAGGLGGLDIWTSTRASTWDPWSPPTNLGATVNSPVNDLRASLSWNGRTMYFGSVRAGGEGSMDLYAVFR